MNVDGLRGRAACSGAQDWSKNQAGNREKMKTSSANGCVRGLLLISLSFGPVGCFIVGSGGSVRSSQQLHQRRSSRSVDRPLHQRHYDSGRREALVAHACGGAAGGATMPFGTERSLATTRRRAELTAGMNRLRHQVS